MLYPTLARAPSRVAIVNLSLRMAPDAVTNGARCLRPMPSGHGKNWLELAKTGSEVAKAGSELAFSGANWLTLAGQKSSESQKLSNYINSLCRTGRLTRAFMAFRPHQTPAGRGDGDPVGNRIESGHGPAEGGRRTEMSGIDSADGTIRGDKCSDRRKSGVVRAGLPPPDLPYAPREGGPHLGRRGRKWPAAETATVRPWRGRRTRMSAT